MRFQRLAQTATLLIFVALLLLATNPLVEGIGVDLFLRLDPVLALGTALAAREFYPPLIPAVVVLAAGLLVGRLFCGYVCPMGATLDALDACFIRRRKLSSKSSSYESTSRFRRWKYVLLAVIFGAGISGVSLVHVGSPLSLTTRLWGLVVYPIVLVVGDQAIQWSSALARTFPGLEYVQFPQKVFAANAFVALIFACLVLLACVQPRFWCRNLCPAGALIGLLSRSPLIKRRVSDACTNCGRCSRSCPMGAIPEDPERTVFSECIVCQKCREVCPTGAVSFSAGPRSLQRFEAEPDPTRRGILLATGAGLLVAGVLRTGVHQPSVGAAETVLTDPDLVRPPGALPEPELLARCVRCGECMKACPTNTLQPVWLKAGLEGIFTPVMLPRLAGCSDNCNVCGKVCPTGAIRDLPLIEKQHAKVGTAWINRRNCLVWEQDRKCLVCDEVCLYNAIVFKAVPGLKNAAPFVEVNRCTGCGWCESKCPVQGASAIRVNILGEVRLASGSYVEKAREYGFVFKGREAQPDRLAPETFESLPQTAVPETSRQPMDSSGEALPQGFLPK